MSLISDIFAGGTEGVLKGVRDVVTAFKADPLELAKLEAEFAKLEADLTIKLAEAQTHINEVEAASQDKFTSRWRPFIGWVCGFSLLYAVLGYSFLNWVMVMANGVTVTEIPELPKPDTTLTFEILIGMLGLGGLRTYEKLKGINK